MRPYAPLRVALVLGFLVWVIVQFGYGLIHLAEPPARVRAPDTAGIPTHEVNPRPTMGTLPPTPALSEAQARETLREHGYFDVASMAQQPDGSWTVVASRSATGGRTTLRIDRDGRVTPP
jgi:hypothetical protein